MLGNNDLSMTSINQSAFSFLEKILHHAAPIQPIGLVVECLPIAWETSVQSQVKSYQRLKKWYLILPCLTFSIIRYVSRIKWSKPGKGVAPFPTHQYSSYRKGSFHIALDYGCQLIYVCTCGCIYVYGYELTINMCIYVCPYRAEIYLQGATNSALPVYSVDIR